MVCIMAWGVYVRIGGLSERPFWIDEAWVAYAVTHQSYGELWRQTELPMPPLFAVTTKLLGQLVSPPELGLRLLPAVCGIACVPLIYPILRTVRIPRIIAYGGMAMCASSPVMVYWSRELKQYEVEALFAVLLALIVFRVRSCSQPQGRWLNRMCVILLCLLGPWFGYGTVFPTLALLTLLLVLRPERGDRQESVITAVLGLAALGVSAGGVWHLAAAAQASNPALIKFTSPWLVDPLNMHSWLRAGAYAALSTAITVFPVDVLVTHVQGYEGIALIAIVAAIVWLAVLIGLFGWPGRGRWAMACWIFLPWLMLLSASIAHYYPFAQARMMVCVVVSIVPTLALGVTRIARECSLVLTGRGRPGLVAGLILACVPAIYMIHVPTQPERSAYQDFPTVLEVLRHERQPGELVAVTLLAVPCVRYYADNLCEPMVYMPTTAGTLPLANFDSKMWAVETVQRAGSRWWILANGNPGDRHRQYLLQTAQQHGYQFKVVAEAGVQSDYGLAQLIRVQGGFR